MSAVGVSNSRNERYPMVEMLLDAGAHVNSPPSEVHTSALQAAMDGKHFQFVDRFLDADADFNAHDARFGTAFSSAARWGRVDLLKKLFERGADFALGGEKYGQVSNLNRLAPSDADFHASAPLQAAARGHHLAAVEYLLSIGADVDQLSGRTGHTLHAACRTESEDGKRVIEMLLEHGVDPNLRAGKYETALQAAAKHGCLGIVKLLLASGADPTIRGGKYGSPLEAALAGKKHYHVANFLRRHLAAMERHAAESAPKNSAC
jgi:ankyrin repeat domain-containing protein 50